METINQNANGRKNAYKLLIQNVALLLLAVVIALIPVLIYSNEEFAGTDDQAGSIITEIAEDYTPWFSSLIQLHSKGIENLLFTVQASLGALLLGFGLGYYKGRGKGKS